jgi:hypothetical protein
MTRLAWGFIYLKTPTCRQVVRLTYTLELHGRTTTEDINVLSYSVYLAEDVSRRDLALEWALKRPKTRSNGTAKYIATHWKIKDSQCVGILTR